MEDYNAKYLKYKAKYIKLKTQMGSGWTDTLKQSALNVLKMALPKLNEYKTTLEKNTDDQSKSLLKTINEIIPKITNIGALGMNEIMSLSTQISTLLATKIPSLTQLGNVILK